MRKKTWFVFHYLRKFDGHALQSDEVASPLGYLSPKGREGTAHWIKTPRRISDPAGRFICLISVPSWRQQVLHRGQSQRSQG